jgi:hypothetical protein
VATTRRIVRSENISVNWPNDPNISSADLGNYTDTATSLGGGASLTIYGSPDNTQPYTVYASATLNTSSPGTSKLRQTFTVGDLRIQDPVTKTPASRCKVNFDLGISINASFTPANGVVGTIAAEAFLNGVSYPKYYPSIVNGVDGSFYRSDLPNAIQTGSDIQLDTAGVFNNTLWVVETRVSAASYLPSNEIGNSAVNYMGAVLGGVVTRTWEADLHTIDANDPAVFQNVVSSFTVDPLVIKYVAQIDELSNFSLNEDSINKKICPVTSFSSVSSFTVEPFFIIGFTKSLESTTNLLASTANLKLGEANITGSSTLSVSPTFKHGDILSLTSSFTSTQSAGLIYDINADYSWNTFNLNIYFESGFVEEGFVSAEGEYNWNYLETTAWDDWPTVTWIGNESTWDNWPDDVWEQSYRLDWLGTLTSTAKNILNIGNALEYTGAFALAENSAFQKASSADLNSEFTTSFTASGVIDVSIDMAGAFAPDLAANIITDIGETITLTGVFTPILTANAITDLFADIDAAFTFEVIPTHRLGPYQLELQSEITDFSIVPTFKPGGIAHLFGFATQLSTARLFFSTDPYNIWSIKPETRIANIAEENRQTIIDQEKRVNIISAETRSYLVPQETRRLKLKIPPFKNRTSMPRVRAEQ